MKLSKIAFAVALTTGMSASVAQAEISGNIGATSDYVWRGVTQGPGAAVSGGLDWANDSGVYAGIWTSNTGFSSYETDFYGGFAGEAGSVGYDLGVNYYAYDQSCGACDFVEVYASVSMGAFSAGLNTTVDSQNSAAGTPFVSGDLYVYASGSYDMGSDLGLGVTIGSYMFDEDGTAGADLDYNHVQIDITKSAGDLGDFTWSLSKTDAEAGNFFTVNGGLGSDQARTFVSWSKGF